MSRKSRLKTLLKRTHKKRLLRRLKAARDQRQKQPPEEILNEFREADVTQGSFTDPFTGDQRSVFEELQRYYKLRDAAWQIPIPPEFLHRIDAVWQQIDRQQNETARRRLRKKESEIYRRELGTLVRTWLDTHPELKDKISTDFAGLHYFVVWAAFQVWTGNDQKYADWLWTNVLEPVVKYLRRSEDVKKAFIGKAYIDLVERVIPSGIYAVTGALEKYLQWCVKHFFLDQGRKRARRRKKEPAVISLSDEAAKSIEHPFSEADVKKPVIDFLAKTLREELPPFEQQLFDYRLNPPDDARLSNRALATKFHKDEKTIRNGNRRIEEVARRLGTLGAIRRLKPYAF